MTLNDLLKSLTDGRKLRGVVKQLSKDEIQALIKNLSAILDQRIEKEKHQEKLRLEKEKKLVEIQKQMNAAGVTVEDLVKAKAMPKEGGQKTDKTKRPIKYAIKDDEGGECTWTGIGRMPKVFANALEQGKTLDEFRL